MYTYSNVYICERGGRIKGLIEKYKTDIISMMIQCVQCGV